MAFKQLKDFNLALLAKKGWRLQTNLDSLVSKIFLRPINSLIVILYMLPWGVFLMLGVVLWQLNT